MEIEENVPLSQLTTFRTGGSVRFLLSLDSASELPEAARFSKEKNVPLIPFGGGSNMLAPDSGIDAAFVRLRARTITAVDEGDTILYSVDAGASWDELVARAVTEGAWGIENLSGIPGSAGAAAVQNIGAYGAAFSDTLQHVSVFDFEDGATKVFENAECKFGYRTSIFKEERDRFFITGITLRLSRTPRPNLSYRDLKNRFGESSSPSLQEIRDAVIEIRKKKFPPLSEYGTAGSFFLNPIVQKQETEALVRAFPDMPLFDLPEGGVKIPLGWIFDRVLMLKGMREGKAFVWEQQALVIAAETGASYKDVIALAEKIKTRMREKTGIRIAPEVRIFK